MPYGIVLKDERPTSNAQHRMLNGEKMKKQKWLVLDIRFSFDVRCWMFDVGRSSFRTIPYGINETLNL